jgi:hypothetical protein
MKVKCKICGQKGFFDSDSLKPSEFHASRFLFIGRFLDNKSKPYFVCRHCVKDILESLSTEQYRIDDLYKPEIKEG